MVAVIFYNIQVSEAKNWRNTKGEVNLQDEV